MEVRTRVASAIWRYRSVPTGLLRRIERSLFRRAYPGRLALGASARIAEPKIVKLHDSGRLSIGDGTKIEAGGLLNIQGECSIGADCYISIGVIVGCSSQVQIGDRVAIGPNVGIFDTNKRYEDTSRPIIGQGEYARAVTIGDDCWIGAGAIVLAGSTVNDHSVIAAGAVVSGEVPPNSLVGGVPAKVLRRFPSRRSS